MPSARPNPRRDQRGGMQAARAEVPARPRATQQDRKNECQLLPNETPLLFHGKDNSLKDARPARIDAKAFVAETGRAD